MTVEECLKQIQLLYNNEHLTKIQFSIPEEIKLYELRLKYFDNKYTKDSDSIESIKLNRNNMEIYLRAYEVTEDDC